MEKIFTDLNKISQTYLNSLRFNKNKTTSKIERDEIKANILSFTYGLENKKYSREEIALISNITIERVRQIIKEILKDIRNQIFKPETSSLFGENYDSLIEFKHELSASKVISYNSIFSEISLKNNDSNIQSLFNLMLDIFDFQHIDVSLHHLKNNNLIITSKDTDKNNFLQICYASFIVVEKNTIPIDLNDLFIGVKSKLKKISFTKSEIVLACEVIDAITLQHDGKYVISFDKLSSASDMAYRILFEANTNLKLAEILKQINFRILNTLKKRITKISLNSQMNMDSRLVPIGKSGYWSLREWQEENKTMYELITDTLTLFNKPLKKEIIYAHIQKTRPHIPIRSLDTVIYNKRYCKVTGNKFILSEWKDLYKGQVINTKARNVTLKENPIMDQIKNQIINLFEQNNSTTILLSAIVISLNKKFNFPKASIYKIVSENSEFETKLIGKTKKIVMYKSQIKNSVSKTKTTSVFISYSWDGRDFREKIISFVEFLRNNGFEADMDIKLMQDETATDFNILMHKGILNYDKVIVMLSPNYKTKAEAFEGGVGKEYRFICNDIEKNSQKYVFASFTQITNEIIDSITPIEFKGREIVDLFKDESNDFETLFMKLTDTKIYKFSDVAENTPIIESKPILPFTLKK